MVTALYDSSLGHHVIDAHCRRNQLVVQYFIAGLLLLLLHICSPSMTFGQDSQSNATEPNQVKPVVKSSKSKKKFKPKSGYPSIEAYLSKITQASKLKLQIKNTTYFNHEFSNHGESCSYFRIPSGCSDVLKKVQRGYLSGKKTHDNVRRMLTQFPDDWPKLNLNHCEWFGRRNNSEDANYGILEVLVVDKRSKNIYLFVSKWDYTP